MFYLKLRNRRIFVSRLEFADLISLEKFLKRSRKNPMTHAPDDEFKISREPTIIIRLIAPINYA